MKSTFNDIAHLLGSDSDSETEIDTLLTDSRNLHRPATTLFFAIRTPGGNDGHNFISALYRQGVRHFVVNEIPSDMKVADDAHFIITDDVIGALQKVAQRKDSQSCEVIAITGSRGKTTLKEWAFQLLEPDFEISRSPRSFNSQIGVPLSLWQIEPTTGVALIEAGISQRNEMPALAECIRPDTVVFTNIGDAHASGFASKSEKASEKALLASWPGVKTIIFDAGSSIVAEALAPYLSGRKVLTWSVNGSPADVMVECRNKCSNGKSEISYVFKGASHSFQAPVDNEIDLQNTAAALTLLLHEEIPHAEIVSRFGRLEKIGTRLNVAEGMNGCHVIHDSYTSDVSSLRPAIDFMLRRAMPGQNTVVILSDILHETAGGGEVYHAVAQAISEAHVNRFIGVGPELKAHAKLFPEDSQFFGSTQELLEKLSASDFDSEIILLKGAPGFNFGRISELLEARKHETVLEVNLDSLVANFNYFRHRLPTGTGLVAMVKASGYGAGSYEIAKTLQDAGAAYLAVAVLDEGLDLRRNGITMPIMVMNPKVMNYKSMFANRLEPEIYTLDMLRDVIREGEKNGVTDYPVHLKLDTGMHRMGLLPEELEEALKILSSQSTVRLSSLFSHLATADCLDMDDYTQLQLKRFSEMTDFIISRYPFPVRRHVLNTAGILRYPDHHYDMARLGIGLYGVNTLPPDIESPLRVVSTLRTIIISIREWEAGETIGYGRKGVLNRHSRIATIPIGYADGMNRHFGQGKISVIVNGRQAPTVGNICMDACMIDVTDIGCQVGDSVEIFGPNASVERLAEALDTIPYEILTSVSPRVKRVYYRE